VLLVHFSGFYGWLKEPLSRRAQEGERRTSMTRKAWADRGKMHGYRTLAGDLCDQGERISNRMAHLASMAVIAALVGCKRCPGHPGGDPAVVAENRPEQDCEAAAPERFRVMDIT
jgi:putative transposase